MTNSTQDPSSEPDAVPLLESKKFADRLFYSLVGMCALLLLVDVFYQPEHSHWHFDFEGINGFHAAFGFLAYVGIVNSAKLLRRFVKRDEDYYGE